jgi:hypothetical protein
MKHELAKVTLDQAQSLLGKETAEVNLRVLLPMLVYLRKLFTSVQSTHREISRFIAPEDYVLSITLEGFTPEDFNALNSLSNSMGAEFTAMLDEMAKKSPQMARPGVYTKEHPKFEAPRETKRPMELQDMADVLAEDKERMIDMAYIETATKLLEDLNVDYTADGDELPGADAERPGNQ